MLLFQSRRKNNIRKQASRRTPATRSFFTEIVADGVFAAGISDANGSLSDNKEIPPPYEGGGYVGLFSFNPPLTLPLIRGENHFFRLHYCFNERGLSPSSRHRKRD